MTGSRVRPESLERLRAQYGAPTLARQLDALARDGSAIDDAELWLACALKGDFKDMPIELVPACPCGSPDMRLLSRFVFWNLLGLRECRRCSLLLVSPRLTPAAMAKVFNESYFADADPSYWGRRREPVFREIAAILRALGSCRIADVGAAYGHFLHYAAARGIEGVGCDLSRPVVEWGRQHLGVDLHCGSIDSLAGIDPVDAVVSLDVLYYCADPVAELARMRELVRPGGHVVLRLRNPRNVARRARQEGRATVGRALLPSEHLYAFPPRAIACLLEAVGLQLVRCTPAAYSSHRWSQGLQLFAALNRGSRRVLAQAPILTQSFNVLARRAA